MLIFILMKSKYQIKKKTIVIQVKYSNEMLLNKQNNLLIKLRNWFERI